MNEVTRKDQLFATFTRYVSLNVLGMIGLSCYILADTFFIARGLGADGLTALNLAIPIFSVISGLGLMIGMGGATRYAILKGMEEKRDMNAVFTRSIMLAAGISFILLLIGVFYADPLSTLLGADEIVHPLTSTYLRTILIFAPAFMMNNILICFIRNDGDPNLSMAAMLTGSFSNIILDYIFVFPLKMGMFGAAFATGLAPIISMMLLSTHFIRGKNHFKWSKVGLPFRSIRDICALGSASLIMELSSGIVMLVFNTIILKIEGNIGVAAYGIIANLALVVVAIFTGIAQGIQPIISHNYGMGEMKNTLKIYRFALATSIAIAIFVYGISYCFSEPIVNIFNKDGNLHLTQLAIHGVRVYFTAFLFAGINIISATYFSATDQAMKSFIISILRGFVAIIPLAFLLSAWFGMSGVWLTLLGAEVLTICCIPTLLKKKELPI